MKLFHRVPPLDAPKQDDEVEFTPLQLTRLRWTAINFQNIVIAGMACMIIAGTIAVYVGWRNDQAIVRARSQARYAECGRDNKQSDEAVAYNTQDAKVLVAAAHGLPLARFDEIVLNERELNYLAEKQKAARDLFPQRKCDKASIDAYYRAKAVSK